MQIFSRENNSRMKNILCREIFVCFPVSTYLLELRLLMIHMNEWKLLRQADRAGGSLGWRNKICIEHKSLVEKLLSFESVLQRRSKMDRRRRRRIFGFRKKTEDEDEDSSEFLKSSKIFEESKIFASI